MSLRTWLKTGGAETDKGMEQLRVLLGEIGKDLRVLHSMRFFLFAAAAKDILIRDTGTDRLAWWFLDLPYSRFLPAGSLASWGQRRDVGALVGSTTRFAGEGIVDSFYTSYLKDPLGRPETAVRKNVLHGVRIYNHELPLSRARRGIRRGLKKLWHQTTSTRRTP